MSAVATPPVPTGTTTPPPVAHGPQPWKWSREDYYKLGELGFFQGKRVELIRGEIVEMSPINWPHRLSTGLVTEALERVFATGFYVDVQQPFSVPGVQPGSEPEPDVAVIPGRRRDYSSHPNQAAFLVEVADTTLFYDTTTKAQLYAEAGILDYWVLDVTNRQLHVLRDPGPIPDGGRAYRTRLTLGPTESVSPLAASQTTIRVADLLP
jgi:Uma2 family endonuclease